MILPNGNTVNHFSLQMPRREKGKISFTSVFPLLKNGRRKKQLSALRTGCRIDFCRTFSPFFPLRGALLHPTYVGGWCSTYSIDWVLFALIRLFPPSVFHFWFFLFVWRDNRHLALKVAGLIFCNSNALKSFYLNFVFDNLSKYQQPLLKPNEKLVGAVLKAVVKNIWCYVKYVSTLSVDFFS